MLLFSAENNGFVLTSDERDSGYVTVPSIRVKIISLKRIVIDNNNNGRTTVVHKLKFHVAVKGSLQHDFYRGFAFSAVLMGIDFVIF
jgi:hypothetical protein